MATVQFTRFHQAEIDAEVAKIPSHLDADELVYNSYLNASDAGTNPDVVTAVIIDTIRMYIDQDVSSF